MKSSNILSKLKGKKLNNSSKKLKVSANPLGLLAENRSNKKACCSYGSDIQGKVGAGISRIQRDGGFTGRNKRE